MYGVASTACVTGVLVNAGAAGGGAEVVLLLLQAVSRKTINETRTTRYRGKQKFPRDAVVIPVQFQGVPVEYQEKCNGDGPGIVLRSSGPWF